MNRGVFVCLCVCMQGIGERTRTLRNNASERQTAVHVGINQGNGHL